MNGSNLILVGFRTLFVAMLAVTLMGSFTLIISDNTQGATTIVTVVMDDINRNIDTQVTNTTIYKGEVEVFTTSSDPVLVKLAVFYDEDMDGWQDNFNPETMFFDKNTNKRFDVAFTLPDLTRAKIYEVIIGGYWQFEGSDTWNDLDKLKVYLTVKQYYHIAIEPDESMLPYIEVGTGSELNYDLMIANFGNGKDSLSLNLLNDYELSALDWLIQYKPSSFDLAAFGSIRHEISITPPSVSIPFETMVQFQLVSSSDDGLVEDLTIYIYSEPGRLIIAPGPNPLIILRPLELPLKQLKADDDISFRVEARGYIDGARIKLEPILLGQFQKDGSAGFEMDFQPSWFEQNIDIKIEPASLYLEPGDKETFTVTITGQNDTAEPERFAELLILDVVGDNARSNTVRYEFVYITTGREDSRLFLMMTPVQFAAVSTFSIIAVVLAAAGSTEFGRYSLLMLFIPLYTKLHKDKVLDHFTRGRIYEFIRSHQGAHFSEIKRELRLTNGGLAYHLYTLEREELIRSYRSGKLKQFYTRDFGIPKEDGRQFSELEAIILDIIDENPGISQRDVGELILNRNHRTVSHNIKQLSREGYIRLEKEGRSNQCFIDFSNLGRDEEKSKKESELQKFTMTYRI